MTREQRIDSVVLRAYVQLYGARFWLKYAKQHARDGELRRPVYSLVRAFWSHPTLKSDWAEAFAPTDELPAAKTRLVLRRSGDRGA